VTPPHFTPAVRSHLNLSVATGHPSSGIDPAAEQQLADAINAYGIQLADLAFSISRRRSAAIVGPAQVAAAVDAALGQSKAGVDWPGWLGGFFLGIFGNSLFDFFPLRDLDPVTLILALVGLVGAAVCACFAVKRAVS
jgi:hypothetical protein